MLQQRLQERFGTLVLTPMQADDMDDVMMIEKTIYAHPWTRGNFIDSLYSGYQAHTLRDANRRLLGYFLMMLAIDEAHLLNISIASEVQKQGLGRWLLDRAVVMARDYRMQVMLLEVRVLNSRAQKIYEHYGFSEIGRRRNYYPASGNTREDAIVMSLSL